VRPAHVIRTPPSLTPWSWVCHNLRRRVSVALCLLAFAVQLAAPMVHMLEVATQQTDVASAALSLALPHDHTQHWSVLSAASTASQRLLHDATLCPVCQALTQSRNWISNQGKTTGSPSRTSWGVLFPLFHPQNVWRYAEAARAPPSTFQEVCSH